MGRQGAQGWEEPKMERFEVLSPSTCLYVQIPSESLSFGSFRPRKVVTGTSDQ